MLKYKCVSMLQNTFKLNNDPYLFGWYLKKGFDTWTHQGIIA